MVEWERGLEKGVETEKGGGQRRKERKGRERGEEASQRYIGEDAEKSGRSKGQPILWLSPLFPSLVGSLEQYMAF